MEKASKAYRSLTFRGKVAERSCVPNVNTGIPKHHFIDARGLAALAPNAFEFNMPGHLWDITILHELSISRFVRLKAPLCVHSDCFELGNTLRGMTSLKSLIVTDIPNRPHFLANFPFLGPGILSRSAMLRKLDLWITNLSRPDYYCDTWERVTVEGEALVTPDSLDWFFGWLFPQYSDDWAKDHQQKSRNLSEPIPGEERALADKPGRLKLERLRLRHIDLPSYAFEEIFNGQCLKELSLPFCDVDTDVWQSIGTEKLVRVADLNYDLLSQEYIRFL